MINGPDTPRAREAWKVEQVEVGPMSDAAIFITVFVGLFVLRVIAATVVFFWILPRGDRCPNCDAVTVRVRSPGWNRLMPWFRTSWCMMCGWTGLLRHGPVAAQPTASKQLTNRR